MTRGAQGRRLRPNPPWRASWENFDSFCAVTTQMCGTSRGTNLSGREVIKGSRVLSAVSVWLSILTAYCIVQTIANGLSKELQDWLLWTLPVWAGFAAALAVRTAPPMRIVPRLLIAGGSAFTFGAVYSFFFSAIIVNALNLWRGADLMLQPIQSVIGALILVSVISGIVAGGLAASDDRAA